MSALARDPEVVAQEIEALRTAAVFEDGTKLAHRLETILRRTSWR